MHQKWTNEIKATILFAFGIIILASLASFSSDDLAFFTSNPNVPAHNLIRGFGAHLAGFLLFLIGWSGWLLPLFIFFWSIRLFKQQGIDFRFVRVFGFIILLLAISSLLAVFGNGASWQQFSQGGLLGYVSSNLTVTYFGRLGAYIIFLTLTVLSLALVLDILVSTFFVRITQRIKGLIGKTLLKPGKLTLRLNKAPALKANIQRPLSAAKPAVFKPDSRPRISVVKPEAELSVEKSKTKPLVQPAGTHLSAEAKDYQIPSLDLLDSPPPLEERKIKEDLAGSARTLEETLADFGISVKVTNVECGPVITRYELEPAPGVKVNRIVSLSDDIALAMKAQSVRIVAPIPGKGRVGVEIPNIQSSMVYLKEVLSTPEFQKSSSKITLALGKDITGKPVIADLTQMPHMLIAGTTGSGKTVCVNSLILSLLFRATPDEVKLLMVDPKMVELAAFNHLPHLLCPVVTDAKKAALALNWVVNEMEERYQLFAREAKRNIEAYNESKEKIPYIIVIIDELADLMAISQNEVESAITRLAQLSRAVGIHLVLVTQRPSVDVITGVIKANFPARVSFQVASKVDSRTVLDSNGADKLLGRGDMLFLKPGESKLIRAQGSLVSDKEIDRITDFIREQGSPTYDEDILKEQQRSALASSQKDELYEEAVRLIIESGQASVSILQRRMRLGYTRAARIIDSMEQEGIIGQFEGSKARRILVDREEWLKENTLGKAEAGN
ncbi:MAG: DNA translocase FtsK [Candidatus Omnitrophica bacterium]|nr:DNA translocase FtsK [Candidatus Omnitrophota bacterium]MBU1871280.1 DNA translocase FtsK [Candidatus Omnitrophota bacterium]